MHREYRECKKVIAIITSLITITIALYIYQFAKLLVGKNTTSAMLVAIMLGIITLSVLIKETRKCKRSYKYCIISDKLIINRIENKYEENVESLRMKDILYIGESYNLPKKYNRVKCCRHYIRNFDKSKKVCCVYRKNGEIFKFIFEPSNVLVQRIESSK